jgi:3-oxoisoapionate kinase
MDKDKDTGIFLSFYGDDFTGSCDVMEALSLNGLPCALFLQPPTPEEVKGFRLKNRFFSGTGEIAAFGVAGVSRSLSPAQMRQELPDIFAAISRVPARFFHYKVCSTFDSSPSVGNIGQAVELALAHFPSRYIPLLVAAPVLNRFCVFGNLFARAEGVTYRLDRHPTMARHPVTPMGESDLRLHLAAQTSRPVYLRDVLDLEEPDEATTDFIRGLQEQEEAAFLLFDVLDDRQLRTAGRAICEAANEKSQLLVGSSGIEYALTAHLQEQGSITKTEKCPSPGEAERVIVMAGSCAPGTQKQIEWARQNGFVGIQIDAVRLASPDSRQQEAERVLVQAQQVLQNGQNPLLYTALGPDDPSIALTKKLLREGRPAGEEGESSSLGHWQGLILKQLLETSPRARVAVAGGDTSGQVARALGIYALEILVPIAPGSPLCLAHSHDPRFDGMEIALKGGQNGNEMYFGSILRGEALG